MACRYLQTCFFVIPGLALQSLLCLLLFGCDSLHKAEVVDSLSISSELKPIEELNRSAKPPNIIFLFADDWGYGDLGCYGATEVATPNIDQLAKKGTRFTQFYTTSGVCSPSRASVLTGHFPARHRVHGHFATNEKNERRGMPNWLDENLKVYLPRLMQEAGYVTAHFGKWHLGGGGYPNGDTLAPEPKVYGYDETRVWNGNGPTWKGDQHWPKTRYMDDDTTWVHSSSRIVIDETIDFISRKKDDNTPFFINLWLKDPHTPLWPTDAQKKPYKSFNPDKETYFAVLTDADYHVGRLMQYLEAMNLEENTLVIFSSDNGPAGYGPALKAGSTGGLRGRKVSVFEGGINVPFIVYWKGRVKSGQVDNESVLSAVDLLPTFCELADQKLPEGYVPDGESFATIFENKIFKRTKPLFWDWRFANQHQNLWVSGAVRDGDWKLLSNKTQNRKKLFNIRMDRFETKDLADNHPEKVQQLFQLLEQWQQTLPE